MSGRPKRMRRPRLTPERIESLKLVADKLRHVSEARRDGLFTGTRKERAEIRRAISFIDDLMAWNDSRRLPRE